MDTASTLIGIGLLALFIAPVAYILLIESFNNRNQQKQFSLLSKQYGLNFTQKEFFPNFSLGLDELSRKLVVLARGKNATPLYIDLNSIRSTELKNRYSEEKTNYTLDDICEISLDFQSGDQSSEERKIVFYEADLDSVLQKEARMISAEKWHFLIKQSLKK